MESEYQVPTLGDLSRYKLEEAIEKIDRALRDAPQELRDAVSIVKLVTGIPRRAPWYGVPMDSDDNSVTVGVVLGNLASLLETQAWRAEQCGASDGSIAKSATAEAQRLRDKLKEGRRSYHDYLDHLLDPERHENELAERRLRERQAAELERRLSCRLSSMARQP